MVKGNREMVDTIGNGFAGDVSPWLKFLDRKKMEVIDRVLGGFLGKLKQEFEEHKKTLDPSTKSVHALYMYATTRNY